MDLDLSLIRKYKLENVRKRMNEMNAYDGCIVTEALGDPNDPMADQNQQQDRNPQMGQPQMGGGTDRMPQTPQGPVASGQDMGYGMQQNGEGAMGGDVQADAPEMMGDGTKGEPQGNTEIPDDDFDAETNGIETEPEGEDDEVIDVDDLTTSQEETERELGTVNKNMVTLLKVVKQLATAIDDNNKKLEDMMSEYERRNPTEDEKVNIRRSHSGPYKETVDGFWDGKSGEMHDENMVDPRHDTEYVITYDDVRGASDKDVADSLTDFPRKLKDYLKF